MIFQELLKLCPKIKCIKINLFKKYNNIHIIFENKYEYNNFCELLYQPENNLVEDINFIKEDFTNSIIWRIGNNINNINDIITNLPEKTNELYIGCDKSKKDYNLNLSNLPMNLKILTIDGFTSELNLSNLPNNLEELDLSQTYKYQNIDNLPNNIKLLILPKNIVKQN